MNRVVLSMIQDSLVNHRSRLQHLRTEIQRFKGLEDFPEIDRSQAGYFSQQVSLLEKESKDLAQLVEAGERFVSGMIKLV